MAAKRRRHPDTMKARAALDAIEGWRTGHPQSCINAGNNNLPPCPQSGWKDSRKGGKSPGKIHLNKCCFLSKEWGEAQNTWNGIEPFGVY